MKRTYYTNGINEKRFLLNETIPKGWHKGRVKSSATTTGCIWINNGQEARFISSSEGIPEGWVKGRLKSHLNPEKSNQTKLEKNYHHYTDGVKDYLIAENEEVPEGLIPGRPSMSEEQKEKLSKAHMGLHHTEESKKKISINSNNNREKANQTIIKTYGSIENFYKMIHEKGDSTKEKNKSFNISKPEKEYKKYLEEKYGKDNVISSYKSKEYPFRCDFYIPSEDKYIELNLHWTHGFQPYNEEDEFCKKQLLEWQEKAKTSQFYRNAIETWTKRDVEKLRIANENHLNYEVIY